jgi:uncharacterized BrkB/YihY/UPF0761 family membrane protein
MTRYQLLGLVIGWLLTLIIAALAAKILIKVWRDEIDLEFLISDENHEASLSRFQFLVFTFVVAMSLFYLIVIKEPPDYPAIPNQILALLGISGGSYVLSKGIQGGAADKSSEVTEKKTTEVTEKKTNGTKNATDDDKESKT